MENTKLQLHPAFSAALRITLQEEMEFLEMYEEYPLNKKPPQIDILIIKKLKDITLNKTISRIFRTHNIIEYKAPGDYLSVNDFYKVYGYTCFYQSNTDKIKAIDPRELTITFVCSHYPREMLRHLKETRGITANLQEDGIYYLTGDAIPIQLLITHKLTQDENYWLQNLRTDLKAGREIGDIVARYEKNRHSKDYAAVMNLITRANWKEMEAERKMCDALKELFAEELQEENAKGMEKGMERGKAEGIRLAKLIFRLSAQGNSEEEIAGKCGISLEQVREILE